MRRLTSGLIVLFFSFAGVHDLRAHQVVPAVLSIKEAAQNRFIVSWIPPGDGHGQGPPVEVRFPAQCGLQRSRSTTLLCADGGVLCYDALVCTEPGLVGRIEFSSPSRVVGPVSVNIEWQNGDNWFRVTEDEPPSMQLPGGNSEASRTEVILDFIGLGVAHIIGGVDHMLFVLGLLLLVKTRKRLLATVTAFTLAHSITLTAAASALVRVPSGPVEICIAISILLLAAETAQDAETVTRRAPWLVAFSFGLLHGFGFASALSSAEIPATRLPLALFSFNIGVELGQLAALGAAVLLWFGIPKRSKWEGAVQKLATFALGGAATFWLLQRMQTWMSTISR